MLGLSCPISKESIGNSVHEVLVQGKTQYELSVKQMKERPVDFGDGSQHRQAMLDPHCCFTITRVYQDGEQTLVQLADGHWWCLCYAVNAIVKFEANNLQHLLSTRLINIKDVVTAAGMRDITVNELRPARRYNEHRNREASRPNLLNTIWYLNNLLSCLLSFNQFSNW